MNQNSVKIRNTSWIMFIILISFLFLTFPIEAQDAQTFYKNGYQYFSQGDYQKAEENYQKAIDLNKDYEDAHYWLGKVYRQTGQHDKAITQWIEVLRINPRNPYAFRYLNDSFHGTSRVQNGNADYYLNEGLEMLEVTDEVFLNENNYNSQTLLLVIPYLKKGINLQNNLIRAYYWLGEIYRILSRKISWQYTSMAISQFEKLIEIEENQNPNAFQRPPEYWYAYHELNLIYKSLGLNERREGLLLKLKEIKSLPYQLTLEKIGYDDFGYPDEIEIIRQNEELIELWKYYEEGKTFRVINKEVVGEELPYESLIPEKSDLSEEIPEEVEVSDEEE